MGYKIIDGKMISITLCTMQSLFFLIKISYMNTDNGIVIKFNENRIKDIFSK